MGREEMRREIRIQVAAALAGEHFNGSHYSTPQCDNTAVAQKVDDLSARLDQLIQPIMRKLISLHQPGKTPSHPATSCSEILDFNESTPSGYSWLKASDGSSVRMYCDMTRSCKGATGPWMKVAMLDMTNSSNECPAGLRLCNHGNKRLCGINSDPASCSSVMFDTHGIEYSQVCGKIIAYQDKTPDAYYRRQQRTIDQNYVDGVSLTHGRNPRRHIWTFVASLDEAGSCPLCSCPCANVHVSAPQPPSLIGNDYFCDTGSQHHVQSIFYPDNPLWDGEGCGPASTCCSLNNPPWFRKQLPSTTSDDIEMRLCRDETRSNEDIPIEIIEIYVH